MALHTYHKKITSFLGSQIPSFIQEYHPSFVSFITQYYQWAESEGNAMERLRSMAEFNDIDTTLQSLLYYFQKQYTQSVPNDLYPREDDAEASQTATDAVLVSNTVKNIKQYFRSKGSPKAFKYLFRILYNLESRVGPKISTDEYTVTPTTRYYTRLVNTPAGSDIRYLRQQKVTGSSSGATAFVETIREFYAGSSQVHELRLSNIDGVFTENDSLTGPVVCYIDNVACCNNTSLPSFVVGDYVYTTTGIGYISAYDCKKRIATITAHTGSFTVNQTLSNLVGTEVTTTGTITKVITFSEPLSKSIASVSITTAGSRYKANENLVVSDSTGFAGTVVVNGVGPSGQITSVKIKDFGVSYTAPTLLTNRAGDGRAVVTITSNVVFSRTTNVKQFTFPLYTYVVKIAKGLKTYEDIVRRTAHPAGFKLIGHFLSEKCVNLSDTLLMHTAAIPSARYPVIEHYLPYTVEHLKSIGNWALHPKEEVGYIGLVNTYFRVDELTKTNGNYPYHHYFRIGRSIRGLSSGATAKVAEWGWATLELEDPTASSSSSNSSSSSSSNSSSSSTEVSLTSSSSSSSSSPSSQSSSSPSSDSSSSNSSSSDSSSSQSSNESSSSSSSTIMEENAVGDTSSSSSSSPSSISSRDSNTNDTSSSSSSDSTEHEHDTSSSHSLTSSSSSSKSSSSSSSVGKTTSSSSSTEVSLTSSSSDLFSESSSSSPSSASSSSSSPSSSSTEASLTSSSSESSSTEASETSSSSSSSSSSSTEVSLTSSSSTGDDFLHLNVVYQGTSYTHAHNNPGYGSLTAVVANDSFDPDGDLTKIRVVVKNIRGEFNLANALYNKDGKEYRIRRVYHHLGVNTIVGNFSENEAIVMRNADDTANTTTKATLRAIDSINTEIASQVLRYFIRFEEYTRAECGGAVRTAASFGESSSSSSTETSSSTEASLTSSSSSESSPSSSSTETSSSNSSSSQSSDNDTESMTTSSSQSTELQTSSSSEDGTTSSSSTRSSSSSEDGTTSSSSSSPSSASSDSSPSSSSSSTDAENLSSSSSTAASFTSSSSSSSTMFENDSSQSSTSESSSSQSSDHSSSSDSSSSSSSPSSSSSYSSLDGFADTVPTGTTSVTYHGVENVIISNGNTKLYGQVVPRGYPLFATIRLEASTPPVGNNVKIHGTFWKRVFIGDSFYYKAYLRDTSFVRDDSDNSYYKSATRPEYGTTYSGVTTAAKHPAAAEVMTYNLAPNAAASVVIPNRGPITLPSSVTRDSVITIPFDRYWKYLINNATLRSYYNITSTNAGNAYDINRTWIIFGIDLADYINNPNIKPPTPPFEEFDETRDPNIVTTGVIPWGTPVSFEASPTKYEF